MIDEPRIGAQASESDKQGRSPEYDDDLTAQQAAPGGIASAGMGGSNLSSTGMGSNELGSGTTGTSISGAAGGIGSSDYNDTATGARPAGYGATGAATSSSTDTTTGSTGSGGYDANPRGDNVDGAGRDRTDEVTSDETGTLISADKVQGTAVYDAAGERLGTIDSLMLNKRSGKVAYAVMSFGGFLGIGERYHPLPWDVLTYDTEKGGYNVGHTGEQLRSAPNYSRDEIDHDDFSSRGREVDDYYGRAGIGGAGTASLI